MASYAKTKQGRYRVRWRDPNGDSRSRTVSTAGAAAKLTRQANEARDLGQRFDPDRLAHAPNLRDAVNAYLADCTRRLARSSAIRYAYALRPFVDWAERRRSSTLGDLSKRLLAAYYEHQVTLGTTAKGLYENLRAVERFWAWADREEGFAEHCPRSQSLGIPQPIPRRVKAPTWAQCDAMIEAIKPGQVIVYRLAVIMRYTGLRPHQAAAIDWADLDLEASTLLVTTGKSRREKRGRLVPVSRHLIAEISGWGARSGLLVGKPIKAVRRSERLNDAWSRSGVEAAVWTGSPCKSLRKAFTSELARRGADREAVEHLVGHAVAGPRSAYLDISALPMREAVDLVEPIGGSGVRRLRAVGSD